MRSSLIRWTRTNMSANASRILIQGQTNGLSRESAAKASELLQLNHEKHDIVFNNMGMHNHIVHGVLTAFALGAEPSNLQDHYDENSTYQRSPPDVDVNVVEKLNDKTYFTRSITPNQTKLYANYREYFTRKIQESSWQQVVEEHLFQKGDEDKPASILFGRLFAGALHPLIHLGFAIEFEQPALVAEALSLAAIETPSLDTWFVEVDEAAAQKKTSETTLTSLMDQISDDPFMKKAVTSNSRDALRNARKEMVEYASQWQVKREDVEEKAAEMFSAAAYFAGGSLNPTKEFKFDFFYLHSVTSALSIAVLLKQDWLSAANKAKLLEYKARTDLLLYASGGSAKVNLDEISSYKAAHPDQATWPALKARAACFVDDGHSAKFIRSLAWGEQLCAPYKNKFEFNGTMWNKLANMVMDSVESGTSPQWVRGAGFAEAWQE